MDRKAHAIATARKIAAEYSGAKTVLLAGSVLRGEDTPSSDLDMIVVFERLSRAKRSSFMRDGWPVETFVHDPETLRYYMEKYLPTAEPIMPTMVAEGICVAGDANFAKELQNEAKALLAAGPKPWSTDELERSRYMITDGLDDLRHPRSKAELIASGVGLYEQMANFFFRSRRLWCARRKMIPRKIREADLVFGEAFVQAFDTLFASGSTTEIFKIAEILLAPHGGLLFDGYDSEAPLAARQRKAVHSGVLLKGVNHVDLIIPRGKEAEARTFYCDILGFLEIEKPEDLRKNGGLWLQLGDTQVHLSIQDGYDPSLTKAHIAYEVTDLKALQLTMSKQGIRVNENSPTPGFTRCDIRDPFGNRIEFMQAT